MENDRKNQIEEIDNAAENAEAKSESAEVKEEKAQAEFEKINSNNSNRRLFKHILFL